LFIKYHYCLSLYIGLLFALLPVACRYLFTRRDVCRKRGLCYGNVAGWLAVTRLYCIKTAKPILKRFRQSGSHIILVSWDPFADTQFQGELLQRRR